MQTNEDPKVVMRRAPHRLRVVFGEQTIADSAQALVMDETDHPPVYYFPMSDVRMDLLEPTDLGST